MNIDVFPFINAIFFQQHFTVFCVQVFCLLGLVISKYFILFDAILMELAS